MLVANARMYAVNASIAAAWRTVLQWVIARAGVDARVIDYPAPQPLDGLWARRDLGCAFMCGYPLARATPSPVVLAAPVPSAAAYGGRPVYWTDLIVRADAPMARFSDSFGRRMAYTTEESQSGYQALRILCAAEALAHGGRLFGAMTGPLITPRRVIAAVLDGTADAGPLDSYFHELVRRSEPYVAARLRVIGATPPTPIPPLVAAPGIDPTDAGRLRAALLEVEDASELAAARATLALHGFAAVTAADYAVLAARADAADTAGYRRLA